MEPASVPLHAVAFICVCFGAILAPVLVFFLRATVVPVFVLDPVLLPLLLLLHVLVPMPVVVPLPLPSYACSCAFA